MPTTTVDLRDSKKRVLEQQLAKIDKGIVKYSGSKGFVDCIRLIGRLGSLEIPRYKSLSSGERERREYYSDLGCNLEYRINPFSSRTSGKSTAPERYRKALWAATGYMRDYLGLQKKKKKDDLKRRESDRRAVQAKKDRAEFLVRATKVKALDDPWLQIETIAMARYIFSGHLLDVEVAQMRNLNNSKGRWVYITAAENLQSLDHGKALFRLWSKSKIVVLGVMANSKHSDWAFNRGHTYQLFGRSQGVVYFDNSMGIRESAIHLDVMLAR